MSSPIHCPVCGAPLEQTCADCAACLLFGAVTEELAPEDALGRLGHYELLELLARGGMGVVYRARQSDPLREVALKALPGGELHSPEARQRFRLEAEAMARLEHPAILPVYEFGEEDGTPYFTMKLAAGGTLAERVVTYAGKWRALAELMATVADAVHFAHTRGVLHRDLKPGNILFDEAGQPFVSDFGVAKMLGAESDLTRTLALMGTPNYMAPELTRGGKGAASTASDVWSLGIMLYELLAGVPPFRGENLATVLRQLNEEEPGTLPKDVPRDLAIITGRALQKQPARRYPGAKELAEDLRRWLRGDAIQARRQPALEQAWRWLRRHPGRAALLLLIAGGIGLLIWRNGILTRFNHEMEGKNQELRAELSSARVEQAAALLSDNYITRRPRLLPLLSEAAAFTPSARARNVATMVFSLPHAEATSGSIAYRESSSPGETVIPTADLKYRLDYTNTDRTKAKRIIRLVALEAPVDKPEALWQRELDGASALDADLSDSGHHVAFANGWHTELWDTRENRQVGVIDPAAPTFTDVGKVWLVDLHPVEPLLAWLDTGGELWVWRFPGGEKQKLGKPTAPVMGLTFSPAGDKVAVSNGAGVEFWSVQERAVTSSCACPGASHPLHWSERGGLLAGHRQQPEIAVIRDGTVAATFRWRGGRCIGLTSFPGSWRALSVCSENRATVWDMREGTELLFSGGGGDALRTGADGISFSLAQENTRMRLYQVITGPAFHEYDCPFVPSRSGGMPIEVCSDGRLLATVAGSRVLLWDSKHRRLLTAWEPEPGRNGIETCFDPRGGAIFTSVTKGQGVRRHALTWKGDELTVSPATPVPDTAGWTIQQTDATCSRFVLRQAGITALWEGDGSVPVRMMQSVTHSWSRHYLSPLLTYGYTSTSYKILPLYDGASNRRLKNVEVASWAGLAHFSEDERWMFTRARSGFRLVSTEDWRERFHVTCGVLGDTFGHACFSPNAGLGALENHTDYLTLYTIPEGREIIGLHAPRAGSLRAASFSRDGRRVFFLTGNHRLYEWDLNALNAELAKLGLGWEE